MVFGTTHSRFRRATYVLLTYSLLAVARLSAQAPHPTVIMAKVDGKMVRVVGAARNTDGFPLPLVEAAGPPQPVAPTTFLFPERANDYAPGFVTLSLKFQDDRTGVQASSNQPGFFFGDLQVTVSSSVPLQGGFLALVLHDSEFTETSQSDLPARILLQALPDLAANTPVQFRTKIPFVAFQGHYDFFPLTFAAGGMEIRNNAGPKAAEYFSRVDKQRLAVHLKDYLAKSRGADRGAAPALTFQPILPENATLPKEPVAATVSVSAEGWVTDVQLPDTLDPAVADALRQTLGGWLFLPRLKGGKPVSSRIQVPLKF